MLDEILNYFKERNEDSCYQKDKPTQIKLEKEEFLVKPDTSKETNTVSDVVSKTDMELINEQMLLKFKVNSIFEAIAKFLNNELNDLLYFL